jgi:hypothetical protein
MSRSRAAFFAAIAGAAVVLVPLFGAAAATADSKAPSTSTTAHTNGDEWIG